MTIGRFALNIVLQGLQPLIDGKEPVLGTHAKAIDPEARRRLAAACFNKTWTLLEKDDRTPEDDDEMLHCAHASRYHWGEIGTAANRARGEWQCARVYAVLGRPEPALHHARRCLEICESDPGALEDWDLPFAYEALARAHALGGEAAEAARCLAQARALGAAIAEEDERALLGADLATIRT